jgi:transcriptional antiterminator Rof (Rho-off)
MDIDLRLLITLGGMLVSVASAAAIARQQIKHLEEEIKEMKVKCNTMELRLDRNDMTTSINEQKLSELSTVTSPKERESLIRELEGLKKDIAFLHKSGTN